MTKMGGWLVTLGLVTMASCGKTEVASVGGTGLGPGSEKSEQRVAGELQADGVSRLSFEPSLKDAATLFFVYDSIASEKLILDFPLAIDLRECLRSPNRSLDFAVDWGRYDQDRNFRSLQFIAPSGPTQVSTEAGAMNVLRVRFPEAKKDLGDCASAEVSFQSSRMF